VLAVFAVAAAMFVAIFNWSFWSYVEKSTESSLAHETALLSGDPAFRTSESLKPLIIARDRVDPSGQFQYLLVDPRGRRVAGDLTLSARRLGYYSVSIPAPPGLHDPDDPRIFMYTLGSRLPDGSMLVVGRDIYQLTELGEWIQKTTLRAAAVAALLVGIGGWFIGAAFLRRLAAVNDAAGRIMAGDVAQRLPTIGMGEEFNRLSANLNRMLDRIQDLMDSLRQVSSDIAHDLRTPLTRLRSRIGVLKPGKSSLAEYQAAVAQAQNEAGQILETFDALLKIGQVEGGVPRRGFCPVDLSAIAAWVAQAYAPAAEDAGKLLKAEIEPGAVVDGDRELLTQLLANLVSNAIVHTPPGTEISIGLKSGRGKALMTVADDGRGVPAEERDKVLRRFYRLDRSRSSPGAGLGLAMVAAIAELHGAGLLLEDNRPGLRAEVSLDLAKVKPLGPAPAARTVAAEA
jgi:signal transduction histidine kinase